MKFTHVTLLLLSLSISEIVIAQGDISEKDARSVAVTIAGNQRDCNTPQYLER